MVGTRTHIKSCPDTQTSFTSCDLGELEEHNIHPSGLVSS